MTLRNRISYLLLTVLALAISAGYPGKKVAAATSTRNLTVTLNPSITGVTIVDQQSGSITLCQAWLNIAPKCAKVGSMAPTTNPPAAPTGLSVIHNHQVNNPGVENAIWQVWIVNNQTGDLMLCSSTDANGSVTTSSCKDAGVIAP
jgi:hypothetical protein